MLKKNVLIAGFALALCGAAQAQTACSCDAAAVRTASQAALVGLLSQKMVCANVGGELWQEWHNGTTATGGPVVDYKLGSDPKDPSAPVGTYVVGADNTVTYTYGSSSYKYEVCAAAGFYSFCGAQYGGRNITGAKIGGSGALQACNSVANKSDSLTRTR